MRERKRTRATTSNKPSKSTGRTGPPAIPAQVRQAVVARLEPEQRRYLAAGVACGFDLKFKGAYLHIAARSTGPMGGPARASPLCRLKYIGNADGWWLEMFRYRDHSYDTEQDFPNVSRGTPEVCFSVAADFHLLESERLQAGWSRHEPEQIIPRHGEFEGQAMVLPPIRDGQWPPLPGRFSDRSPVGDTPLVADFAAWVHWIRSRAVAPAPGRLPAPAACAASDALPFDAATREGLRSGDIHVSCEPPKGGDPQNSASARGGYCDVADSLSAPDAGACARACGWKS